MTDSDHPHSDQELQAFVKQVIRYYDDALDTAELHELYRQIKSSSIKQGLFVRLGLQFQMLRETPCLRTDDLDEDVSTEPAGESCNCFAGLEEEFIAAGLVGPDGEADLEWLEQELRRHQRRRWWMLGVVLALIVFGCVVLFWPSSKTPPGDPQPITPQSTPASPDATGSPAGTAASIDKAAPLGREIGQFIASVDARWADGQSPLQPKAKLHAGQVLNLVEGVAKLRLRHGVVVILEAPAELIVETEDDVRLLDGKLLASVTGDSQGFTVRTPHARIVDKGTEFGVRVNATKPQPGTDVMVYAGQVELRGDWALPKLLEGSAGRLFGEQKGKARNANLVSAGQGRQIRVIQSAGKDVPPPKTADTAKKTSAATKTPVAKTPAIKSPVAPKDKNTPAKHACEMKIIPAEPLAFVRVEEFAIRQKAAQGLPYYRWWAHSLKMRRDDELLLYYTFQVKSKLEDHLVPNYGRGGYDALGEYKHAELAAGRFKEKFALSFGKKDSHIAFKLPQTCENLTLAAWVNVRSLPTSFGPLLFSSDYAKTPGRLQWRFHKSKSAIELAVRTGPKAIQRYAAADLLVYSRLKKWIHYAVVYDAKAAQVRIYFNGICKAMLPIKKTQPIQIGQATVGGVVAEKKPAPSAQFDGLIDELAVWKRVLSEKEIQAMTQAGWPGVAPSFAKSAALSAGKSPAKPAAPATPSK